MSTTLDLHSHSEASEDSRAPLEAYLNWLKLKSAERPVDGIVLTEHRQFNQDADYRALEDKFGVLVLKASEVETDYGHVLVFGVTDEMTRRFDFANVHLPAQEVIDEVALGGTRALEQRVVEVGQRDAVPLTPSRARCCHPGFGSAGRYGQRRSQGAAGTMALTLRGLRAHALRTGPDGLDRSQTAPLVLLQQATQLRVLGSEAQDLVLGHLWRILGEGQGSRGAKRFNTGGRCASSGPADIGEHPRQHPEQPHVEDHG